LDAHAAVASISAPATISFTEQPRGATRNRRPSFAFVANRPVAFACALDGAAPAPCASPFRPSKPLADGRHALVVTGVDRAGRLAAGPAAAFTVDTTGPQTFFVIHPHRLLRTRHSKAKAVFRFGSDERGASFRCRIDRGRFRRCPRRIAHRLGAGRHKVAARALDALGNADPTPAVFRLRVRRTRTPSGP
jgi:hypothetical protein